MDNWGNQFRDLLKSPLGQELERTLREDLHDNLIRSAEEAESQESAFGLLKEARGVIKALEHLKFRTVVPKDEEGE